MIRASIFFVMLFGFFACGETNSEKAVVSEAISEAKVPTKKLEMYNMSQMSVLMEKLYRDNRRLKNRIVDGETIPEMPTYYDKLFSAKMTDPAENDDFFKATARGFVASQKLIYSSPENLKQSYNNSINICIECHKVKCLGPIPRIKKLIIN